MIGYFNNYFSYHWNKPYVRTYTELGYALILSMLLLIFAIRPTLVTIMDLRGTLAKGNSLKEQLNQQVRAVSQAHLNYNEIEKQLPRLEEAVPGNPRILDFFNQVELIAGQYNVLVKDVNYSEEQKGKKAPAGASSKEGTVADGAALSLQPQTFKIETQGNLEDLQKFMDHIEGLPRLVGVDKVIIRESSEDSRLSLIIEGHIYYWST